MGTSSSLAAELCGCTHLYPHNSAVFNKLSFPDGKVPLIVFDKLDETTFHRRLIERIFFSFFNNGSTLAGLVLGYKLGDSLKLRLALAQLLRGDWKI